MREGLDNTLTEIQVTFVRYLFVISLGMPCTAQPELIERFARPIDSVARTGIWHCGSPNQDELSQAARTLLEAGKDNSELLKRSLIDIKVKGWQSLFARNAIWLAILYAAVEKENAIPFLNELAGYKGNDVIRQIARAALPVAREADGYIWLNEPPRRFDNPCEAKQPASLIAIQFDNLFLKENPQLLQRFFAGHPSSQPLLYRILGAPRWMVSMIPILEGDRAAEEGQFSLIAEIYSPVVEKRITSKVTYIVSSDGVHSFHIDKSSLGDVSVPGR